MCRLHAVNTARKQSRLGCCDCRCSWSSLLVIQHRAACALLARIFRISWERSGAFGYSFTAVARQRWRKRRSRGNTQLQGCKTVVVPIGIRVNHLSTDTLRYCSMQSQAMVFTLLTKSGSLYMSLGGGGHGTAGQSLMMGSSLQRSHCRRLSHRRLYWQTQFLGLHIKNF